MQANSEDPDLTPLFVASDQGLRYLPMSHKKDARHIWVKCNYYAYLIRVAEIWEVYLTAKETHIFNIHLIPETLIKFYTK